MVRRVGRYELVRPLARGGMAEVFLARRRGPGGIEKRLALKRIRRERTADPRFTNLFIREARLSMALAHKNIVPVFDFGRAGDELFLVMEYIDGRDLASALATTHNHADIPTLGPYTAAYVAMEACEALNFAHRGQPRVIHRDVTPRNVLLSRAGEVKLADFGVATSETDTADAGKVRGTPAYMSPEQARGDDIDPRSDVFSVGLVLYEALSGTRAYRGTSQATLLAAARAGDVPSLNDDVPAALRNVVARATQIDPTDRFADAQVMQLALDDAILTARAHGEGHPSRALAAWLECIDTVSDHSEADPTDTLEPSGPVFTFLEHGFEQLEHPFDDDAATMRSQAATLAETDPPTIATPMTAAPERDDNPTPPISYPASIHVIPPTTTDDDHTSNDPTQSPVQRTTHGWRVIAALLGFISVAGYGIASAIERANQDTARPASRNPSSIKIKTVDLPESPTLNATSQQNVQPAELNLPKHAGQTTKHTGQTTKHTGQTTKHTGQTTKHTGQTTPASPPRKPKSRRVHTISVGTVLVGSTPWARVLVSNRPEHCDETPCELRLPVGTHELLLVNEQANLRAHKVVTVNADTLTRVVVTLTRP